MKAILSAVVLVACLVPAFGQTVGDIENKYGRREDVYSVSKHIWMTPAYSVNGQVCRMSFYAKRADAQTSYLGSDLMFPELNRVLNELVPPDLRGPKKDGFGLTTLGGGIAVTKYEYESVTFAFVSSYRIDAETLKSASENIFFDFPAPTEPVQLPEQTPPSFGDFARSNGIKTEIVIVSWNDRPCAKAPPK